MFLPSHRLETLRIQVRAGSCFGSLLNINQTGSLAGTSCYNVNYQMVLSSWLDWIWQDYRQLDSRGFYSSLLESMTFSSGQVPSVIGPLEQLTGRLHHLCLCPDPQEPIDRAQLAEMMSHFLNSQAPGRGGGGGGGLELGPTPAHFLPMLQSVCGQVTQLRLDDAAKNGTWWVGLAQFENYFSVLFQCLFFLTLTLTIFFLYSNTKH